MADFAADVSAWVRRATNRAEQAFQATAQDALARVKELTPVRTGNLRAAWSVQKAGEAEETGGVSPPALSAEIKARLGESLVISNPVSYAPHVEYGHQVERKDGSVTKVEGKFMLTQTVAELPRIAERAASRVAEESRGSL